MRNRRPSEPRKRQGSEDRVRGWPASRPGVDRRCPEASFRCLLHFDRSTRIPSLPHYVDSSAPDDGRFSKNQPHPAPSGSVDLDTTNAGHRPAMANPTNAATCRSYSTIPQATTAGQRISDLPHKKAKACERNGLACLGCCYKLLIRTTSCLRHLGAATEVNLTGHQQQ